MKSTFNIFLIALLLLIQHHSVFAQKKLFQFGVEKSFDESILNARGKGKAITWFDVNTSDSTWKVKKNLLINSGNPIGVVRSEKMYENFIMHVEWRHMEKGGNSGIFVWCDAIAEPASRLPMGMEVQMLELDWVNIHAKDGVQQPIAYVHGELFGAGGMTASPDNPRGTRSKSVENRCLGVGQWNKYTVVCIDGTVKLAVNGKFVNSIRLASKRKGYLCLEAEGALMEFRNLQIIELEPGVERPEFVVDAL
ncbi:3-keto-disaccharide hydrolase [Sphingobacterium sp. HJSM2_6]|uniref:3-keto-disaccharide hydrolase n=1 Tax=Sphingobacterium sp. HJSM2_6 TaxID=3366264 RepID=UPI003BD269E6